MGKNMVPPSGGGDVGGDGDGVVNAVVPRWGKSNDIRGAKWTRVALEFLQDYPVGQKLEAEDFDKWASLHFDDKGNPLIKLPPSGTNTDDDAWKAHLHRRHELRYRINRAGAHMRIRTQYEKTPFVVDTVAMGVFEVRSPEQAVALSGAAEKIASLTKTKKRQLGHLMQSTDWDALPEYEKMMAENIYSDIDEFAFYISHKSDFIERKMSALNVRLKRLADNANASAASASKLLSSDYDVPDPDDPDFD